MMESNAVIRQFEFGCFNSNGAHRTGTRPLGYRWVDPEARRGKSRGGECVLGVCSRGGVCSLSPLPPDGATEPRPLRPAGGSQCLRGPGRAENNRDPVERVMVSCAGGGSYLPAKPTTPTLTCGQVGASSKISRRAKSAACR